MKYKIIIASIILLLGNQKTFSQCSYIKGRIIDYETGDPLKVVTIGSDSLQAAVFSDINGNFEIKGNARKLELYLSGYYAIDFINIPIENKHIDLGDIKMVANHRLDNVVIGGHSINRINEYDIEQDKRLRKNVLKKYRIKVLGKRLKPYFEGNKLIFDIK